MGRGAKRNAGGVVAAWLMGTSLVFGQAGVPSQRQATTPAAPADPAKMDRLLQAWEGQSTKLKNLDVVLFRKDSTTWDEIEYYEGRAIFKSPNLAFIEFSRIKQDEKGQPIKGKDGKWDSAQDERIVCTGDEVWQYKSDTKQIFIYPLEKGQAEKAIEEGPLPFLFNMRADEARKRYTMTLLSEDEKAYGIQITPKLDVDKESFSHALVKLDRKFLLPTRIFLRSPDGKSTKDFQLTTVEPNKQGIQDARFKGHLVPNWKVVRNPNANDRPRAVGTSAGQKPPAQEGPASLASPPRAATAPAAGTRR